MNLQALLNSKTEYPLLKDEGRKLLREMVEHPHAPSFSYSCGDRLTATGLESVELLRESLRTNPIPDVSWREEFVRKAIRHTPFHRQRKLDGIPFTDLPVTTRDDWARGIWRHVPDTADLTEMIVHSTSGRTSRPLPLPHHPVACAQYLPLLDRVLGTAGLALEGKPGSVAIALICAQQSTITCATIATALNQSGFVKLNLLDQTWRNAGSISAYLEAWQPEILTGDPVAFDFLAQMGLPYRPKAALSTAMNLGDSSRRLLESQLGCPVLDYYSCKESGIIAARAGDEWQPVAPDVWVEILDDNNQSVPVGSEGKITLTGGRNPFLPLLRYQPGDRAMRGTGPEGAPRFHQLQGRAPVIFEAPDGSPVNSIDITRALGTLPLTRFQLRQNNNGTFTFVSEGRAGELEIREALRVVFGPAMTLTFSTQKPSQEKWEPFVRDAW